MTDRGATRRRWAAVRNRAAVLLALGLICAGAPGPTLAVDRSLGAGIPRPQPGGAAWSAAAKVRLGRDLDAMLAAAPTLRGAHVGLLVLETRSGAELYARNADDAFMPASTFKLLTGSAALALLGPAHRFRTEALLDRAHAQLVLRGGGDALLQAADLDAMARALRGSGGIPPIERVIVDASAFESAPYPPGWSWDDFPYAYAARVSAASIEENVVHLTVAPGDVAGAPVSVELAPALFDRPAGPPVDDCPPATRGPVLIARATTAERGATDTLDVARDPGGCIVLTGALGLGSPPEMIDAAVPDPVRYMQEIARHALAAAGLLVPSAPPFAGDAANSTVPDATDRPWAELPVVWTHDGEPLSDLLADMWWPSDNLVAELLLREIGFAQAGLPGTVEHGADAERAWLRGIGVDPTQLTIADGSGLSSYDRITPRILAAILQADWRSPNRESVIDDLPLAGVRGTLEHSFIGTLAERRTFAKTGSVNHTRALAGYLATLHHGALTFAWSVDDWMGTDDDLRELRARLLSRLIGD